MRQQRASLTTAVLLGLASAVGCAPIDHWRVFETDLDQRIQQEYARTGADRLADPSGVDEPDRLSPLELAAEDGGLELSVEQASILALQNNPDLRVQQLYPLIAGAFEQIERGVFDPELFAEAEWSQERASQTDRATGSQFAVVGEDASIVGGVRQRLPTGTDIEATVEQDRTTSNRSPEQQTARLGLTVTQSLLRGFGPQVNLARVRQAELNTIASVYELRGFTEMVLADTEITYWNYVLAREQIAIFERSLEIAREQRDQVEQRIEVGVLPRTEAAAARAEVARREQALITARSAMREQRLRLLRLISPASNGAFELEIRTVSSPRIEPERITDLDERLLLAERARPDLNEARLRLQESRLETIVTRNGLLPRLELFIALGKTGFDDKLTHAFKNLDDETYDVTAGVRFSQLLGNRAAEGRDLAARASTRQAARAIDNLRQFVRFEVRLAANDVERARQQIAASAVTRALEEQTVEAEQQRFEVGASTTLLVAQAQRDLLASRIAEVEAIINYRIALVTLYLAEGSLLERRGVDLAGGQRRLDP